MKTRVLSAVVGIILLIIVLNFFETPILNIAIMVIALIAMHEFLTATRISHNRLLSAVAYFMAAVFPYVPMKKEMNLLPLFLLPYIALLFLILLKTHQDTRVEDIALVFMMSIGMTMSLSAAIYLRDNNGHVLGMYYLLLALFCAWFSDTGAYFTGKALGKHKLCPLVSPHKTVEGLIGGLVTCVVLNLLAAMIFSKVCDVLNAPIEVDYLRLTVVSLLASLISVLGDLSFSMIKRQFSIKDFGKIMPGHGGVLDRFDSVLFTLPFIYASTLIFPICSIA
ncbi:phosphatidate cytidylyltransferase [uncultured Negativibacillus sp.]|uniref:phosphatidate cytidylyltransferase n=1 Tax=uncultured Negativibacillus sp. TaxID=1980696 RepID=UPI0025E9E599|nr:phosphatidate cytidylyltransferase [uncultured Negativibacillus sp.]